MIDLDKFQICMENIDSEYCRIVISKNHGEYSSVYSSDGQISSLLNINTITYRNALAGQFETKYENYSTCISKKESVDDVKIFLESLLLVNCMGNLKNKPKFFY